MNGRNNNGDFLQGGKRAETRGAKKGRPEEEARYTTKQGKHTYERRRH